MNVTTKEQLIEIVSKKMRLLRTEYNFSQEKMSELLGISKKTLVQIEKDRSFASWTLVIAVCGLFRESEIIKMTIGEDALEIIEAISFENLNVPKKTTSGGRMFWKTLTGKRQFRIQKHLLTGHYRVIDGNDKRWISSFDEEYIYNEFELLIKRGEDHEEETE